MLSRLPSRRAIAVIMTAIAPALSSCVRPVHSPARSARDQAAVVVSPSTDPPQIEVTADHRIELLAIIFRLAGAEEYGMRTVPAYAAAIDTFFAAHRNHPAVATARRLREERGISHDAVMSLAIHLDGVPTLRERVPLETSQLESRWTPGEARRFVEQVRAFVRESGADRFFAQQQPMYDLAARRLRTLIDAHVDAAWFPAYFGDSPSSRFVVAIAPGNGTWSYGPRYDGPDGARELYAVMAVYQTDSAGVPQFQRANTVATIIHEFSHSFVNPVVERHLAAVQRAADTIHAAVAPGMRAQGYGEPRTMISESLVRTAVARYRLSHEGLDSARAELGRQKLNDFLWIDDLFALFGAYEGSRDRFATFDAYFPVIAGYYADLAPRALALVEHRDARRPRVLEITPASGSTGVDPATTTITVRFDRPMRRSQAVMFVGEKPRERAPEIVSSRWDASQTLFTMTVKLKPDWIYEYGLNSDRLKLFISQDWVPLQPIIATFRTGPASPADSATAARAPAPSRNWH